MQTIDGERKILVELQIRTLSMNFWATIEHSLRYKYSGEIPEDINMRLQRAAEAASGSMKKCLLLEMKCKKHNGLLQ